MIYAATLVRQSTLPRSLLTFVSVEVSVVVHRYHAVGLFRYIHITSAVTDTDMSISGCCVQQLVEEVRRLCLNLVLRRVCVAGELVCVSQSP